MKKIGLIVRGKFNEAHEPDLLEQHADVLLSDGAPMGYFGEGGRYLSARIGMGMDGIVYDYSLFQTERPFYVDAPMARELGLTSTACLLEVPDPVADKFDAFWRTMRKTATRDPGGPGFSILGNNCSTNASDAFRAAGVLPSGIPGLDTPQNLFAQLRARYGSRFACQSGYVGVQRVGGKYQLQVLE